MKNALGLLSGFIFGLIAVFLATFGLVSIAVEIVFPLLFPVGSVLRGVYFPGLFPAAILLNGILFAGVGYAIQQFLKKSAKSEMIVVYIFSAIIVLVILALAAEYLIKGLSA